MSEKDLQERTEEATPKRREDSKKKGEVPRSKDLSTLLILLTGSSYLYMFGGSLVDALTLIMRSAFQIDREMLYSNLTVYSALTDLASVAFMHLLPFLVLMAVVAIITPALIGGFSFQMKSLAPKAERMSLAKGLKRMVSVKALMELIKALGKFLVVTTSSYPWPSRHSPRRDR